MIVKNLLFLLFCNFAFPSLLSPRLARILRSFSITITLFISWATIKCLAYVLDKGFSYKSANHTDGKGERKRKEVKFAAFADDEGFAELADGQGFADDKGFAGFADDENDGRDGRETWVDIGGVEKRAVGVIDVVNVNRGY